MALADTVNTTRISSVGIPAESTKILERLVFKNGSVTEIFRYKNNWGLSIVTGAVCSIANLPENRKSGVGKFRPQERFPKFVAD